MVVVKPSSVTKVLYCSNSLQPNASRFCRSSSYAKSIVSCHSSLKSAFHGAHSTEALKLEAPPHLWKGRKRYSAVVSEQAVEELPPKLKNIVLSFQSVADPRARYQQLLHYASKLKPLAKEHQTPQNKVIGCVSQVWVLPTLKEDGNVYFEAESDSALTKGLAALLVEGLSGSPPAAILKITPDFIQSLGLKQSLTPSRNNGFLNMLRLMQKKTLELYAQSEASKKTENGSALSNGSATKEAPKVSEEEQPTERLVAETSEKVDERPIYNSIKQKLTEGLKATIVDVDDVSHEHAGHAGVHRGAKETHFNVRVVSSAFEGISTIKRHRLVYGLLEEEFKQGLHALSLITKTDAEIQS